MWLYAIFAFFDYAVYSVVKFGVRLIMLIANYDFFSEPTIDKIANKIYIVLGVLMLFKIVISAVQYMVNPDTFDDKDKGMGGILKKTVICMVLLVLIKPAFNFAMYMQKSIVSTIPSLILDSSNDYTLNSTGNNSLDDIGNQVAGTTLKAFVTLKSDRSGPDEINDKLESFNDHITDGCSSSIFKGFRLDLCDYDYKFGISTAAGVFLLYVILSMVLDIGIRSIKLGILQIFAPIPISSYIVSKDKLGKFVKLAVNVYVDLFIRLIVVYFIIFFVGEIINNIGNSVTIGDGYTATSTETAFVKIAIIIALFMFAKNAPKFISDVLGISGDGFNEMKDMFKPAWQRVGGLSSPGAAIGAYRNSREYGEGRGTALRRAMSAGGHATATRLKDIASGKDLAESYKSSKEAANARTNKNLEYANRFPNRKERIKQIWQERADKYTGVTTGGKKASAQIEAANRALKARSNAWNRAQSKVVENARAYNGGSITDSHGNVLSYSDMYALFEKDAPEMYAGQKRELASSYQRMKDAASTDFLRQSFAGVATGAGDGQSRNVFAEDVFSIARSGADKNTVGKLLNKDIVVSSGATVHVDAIDAANRINKMNQLRDEGVPLTDPRWAGLQFSTDEAEALAMFARDLNKTAGTVRLEATKTQTTVPKEG